MRIFYCFFVFAVICCNSSQAQTPKLDMWRANQHYLQGEYTQAEEIYKQIEDSTWQQSKHYNLGNTLFRQGQYDQAIEAFRQVKTTEAKRQAEAYHNWGNSLLQQKKLKESLEMYQKALLKDPTLAGAQYNYNLVKKMLKDQENQNKQNQQNKDKQSQKEQKNDQKDQSDQQKDNQKNQQENKQDKDNKPSQADKKEEEGNTEEQFNGKKLSKEDAKRLLDAFEQQNKNVQIQSQQDKKSTEKTTTNKNW